jgi:3,4-dihydroxy 2-butanone 4-phosphate synthase
MRAGSDAEATVDDPETEVASAVDRAIAAFRAGDPVLVHDADDREGETDLLYPAAAATPEVVARVRTDAGGLPFVAVSAAVADAFDLPYLHEAVDHPATEFGDLGYDARPSFSLTVNHRETYTGITDEDRALTVRELGAAAADPENTDFAARFRSPGHVHLLRAAPGLLADREGHTEFGVALAEAAGIAPAVLGAEMLDADSGRALTPADARAYARANDLVYVEGSDLIDALS